MHRKHDKMNIHLTKIVSDGITKRFNAVPKGDVSLFIIISSADLKAAAEEQKEAEYD